jgi:hypothetical protein
MKGRRLYPKDLGPAQFEFERDRLLGGGEK